MIRIATTIALTTALTAQEPAPTPPLEVHEWGTFTSMVGSDGLVLEGLQHEEERLPEFCHELASLEAVPGQKVLKFPATHVTQKMETPVIYFHTDAPMRVEVDVQFPKGLLTQFYPIPMIVAPTLEAQRKMPVDLTKVDEGWLRWRLDLIPYNQPAPTEIPECDADDPWSFARQVRAAYVRTADPKGVQRAVEAEHYVFYRGLARFELPFTLRAGTDGHGEFVNGSAGRVPFAAVLDMNEDGGRFLEIGGVDAGSNAKYSLAATPRVANRKRVAAALGARVFDALVAQGLFEDEARAMIATWSRSWFQSEGTRVIYLLPDAEVNRVLPLRIRPKPDKTVRVLVGRLGHITPEAESAIEAALVARLSTDAEQRGEGEAYLEHLDRFLEPHVRRALARTDVEIVQRSAREVLQQIVRNER